MQKKYAKELLKKYNSGTCTDEERALLESWYLQWKGGEFDLNDEELRLIKNLTWNQLIKSRRKEKKISSWMPYVAASIIFAILSIGFLFYTNNDSEKNTIEQYTTHAAKDDIAPGGNKALLTLADGTVVALDEAANGKIAEVAGMKISKTADGQVVYETTSHAADASSKMGKVLRYNRISTPRGGQYQVILPDGTNVWLNAASSLRYPVQFTETARRVELTGEAYFEVSKQQSAAGDRVPFFVSTSTQTVEVLGTHFNINSYDDEECVKTTLLEGAVRVFTHHRIEGTGSEPTAFNRKNGIVLKPNQQSILSGNELNVIEVNTEESIAWKNGYFNFIHADLNTVMRQLSRWYDVDVVYGGEVPTGTFTGKVYRNMTISKVLEILTYAQVNFKIEGKKLIILP